MNTSEMKKALVRQGLKPDLSEMLRDNFTDEQLAILLGDQQLVGKKLEDFEDAICRIDARRATSLELAKVCLEHGAPFGHGWREFREAHDV